MDSLFESTVETQESWIKTSIQKVMTRFTEAKQKHPFKWDLNTYWEADQLGLKCFENPQEIDTVHGPIFLTGDRNFNYEGRLVFHARHFVFMQFVPMSELRHLFLCQEVFGETGMLRFELECDQLKPIQAFCKEMNMVIHKEVIGLKSKGVDNIFLKLCQEVESHDCDPRLKLRFNYLKDLMIEYRKNPILYRPELERMKLWASPVS